MQKQHPFIDMHIHLFTARYLPLHGIFLSFGLPNWLARGLARFAVAITGMDDLDTQSHLTFSDQLLTTLPHNNADALMNAIAARARALLILYQASGPHSAAEVESVRMLLSALDELDGGLFPMQHAKRPASSRILFDEDISSQSAFDGSGARPDLLDTPLAQSFALAGEILSKGDFFHDAAHLHSEIEFEENSYKGLRSAGVTPMELGSIGEIMVFIGVMVLSERDRYQALEDDYAKSKPANGVDAEIYVGILLDMHWPYLDVFSQKLDPPYFDFQSQIRRMKALAEPQKGRLLSFGSVDPFRGPKHCLANVDYGETQNVAGYKLYPPLGYRAFESKDYVTEVNPAAEDAHIYQKHAKNPAPTSHAQQAMAVIIKHCSENDLRLFAHCNAKGFQVRKGYGVYSDPEHWRQGIEAYKAQNLRLFLAHGGGTMDVDWHGWAAVSDEDFERSFAHRAVRLAQTYEHVYLGLGHILDVLDDDSKSLMQERLIKVVNARQPAGAPYAIGDKLCYGSDWSMPKLIGKTRAYISAFYEIFDHRDLAKCAPGFFKDNALRFLHS